MFNLLLLVSAIVLVSIDFIYLNLIKDYFNKQIQSVQQSKLTINYLGVAICYIFLIAGIIAFIFLLAKFLEMRMVDKESKPLKLLVRDALLVYFSVVAGHFIIQQIDPIINETVKQAVVPGAFTSDPDF